MFFQAGGLVLVLWGREQLAADCGLAERWLTGGGGIALAHNVGSRGAVDEVLWTASQAGAVVTREPAETFYGGHAGVFTDPDGHAWEVAHNPGFALAEDGTVTVPDFGRS